MPTRGTVAPLVPPPTGVKKKGKDFSSRPDSRETSLLPAYRKQHGGDHQNKKFEKSQKMNKTLENCVTFVSICSLGAQGHKEL